MKRAIERAAKKMSDTVKTDADFSRQILQIRRSMTCEELMPAFLNMRLKIDATQVFRVLQLVKS